MDTSVGTLRKVSATSGPGGATETIWIGWRSGKFNDTFIPGGPSFDLMAAAGSNDRRTAAHRPAVHRGGRGCGQTHPGTGNESRGSRCASGREPDRQDAALSGADRRPDAAIMGR